MALHASNFFLVGVDLMSLYIKSSGFWLLHSLMLYAPQIIITIGMSAKRAAAAFGGIVASIIPINAKSDIF